MSDLTITLGTRNGDGRDHLRYIHGDKVFPDTLFIESADARDKSIKNALRHFELGTDRLTDLSNQLIELATKYAQTPSSKTRSAGPIEVYQSIPVDVFPAKIQKYITTVSNAIGCDPCFIVMWLLPALAGCIGNTRRITIKTSWAECSTIWALIIAPSGQHKSPTMKHVLWPLYEWQNRAFQEHEANMVTHREELAEYESAYKGHKKRDGIKPPPPPPPIAERYFANDATIEAMSSLLEQRWRGLPLFAEEACSWFRSFGQYKNGGGGDVGHWLSMHDAGVISNDRKTGLKRTTYIRRANVSIGAGTQPETLRQDAAGNIDNGLLPRFLVAMPPKQKVVWNDNEVPANINSILQSVYLRLLGLQPASNLLDQCPVDMPMDPAAKSLFTHFVNRHGEEQYNLNGALSAVWSKYKAYAARLSLVISLTEWACGDQFAAPDVIDAPSMQSAIRLVEWFKSEARRVYGMLQSNEEDQERQRLADLIAKHGGPISARELVKLSRRYADSETAEEALDDLVRSGFGEWQNSPPTDKGGRPTRRFALLTPCGETPEKHGGK